MADVDANAPAPAAKPKSPVPATREPRKRTRSPPPASPKGRSRRELPTHAVEILKAWLTSPQHFHHPYPTQISASRCVEAPSRHRRASSLGMMEVLRRGEPGLEDLDGVRRELAAAPPFRRGGGRAPRPFSRFPCRWHRTLRLRGGRGGCGGGVGHRLLSNSCR